MKKLLCLLIAFCMPNMAMALEATLQCAVYFVPETCDDSTTYTTYGSTTGASSYDETCYTQYDTGTGDILNHRKYITSLTCNTSNGYSKSTSTQTVCMGDSTTEDTITYYSCECSDNYVWNGWSDYSTLYQRNTGTKTNCGTSTTVYKYRCASGYYSATAKSSATTASDLECTSCATTCGVGHTTSAAGATSYSECKAAADTEFTDDTGTFMYSTACCCDDTCDSKCSSGKACESNSDCDSGTCLGGCCQSVSLVCSSGTYCLTDDDCTSMLYPVCLNGCCNRKQIIIN